MYGGSDERVEWRSSIPGVSQREGAPVSLGIVASGVRGSSRVTGGDQDDSRAGRGATHRGGRGLPWRAAGLGVLGLVAILGVARVAGAEGGPSAAAEPTASPGETQGSAGSPGASGGPGPSAAPASGDVLVAEPPDWWAVLAELDRRRSATLAALDLDSLADHAQPGSPAWDADAALLADLQERGLHPRGISLPVLAVERVARQGGQVQLQIVDQRSAYELVDAQGSVLDRVEPAAPTRWSVTLRQESEGGRGWRLVDVSATPPRDEASAAASEGVP
ncbi:MAG TPA: hypothetical protein VES03_09625 [Motilibacterales bacterium]|nr:hypothetical protein [Motilibacterales bacterium]